MLNARVAGRQGRLPCRLQRGGSPGRAPSDAALAAAAAHREDPLGGAEAGGCSRGDEDPGGTRRAVAEKRADTGRRGAGRIVRRGAAA